MANIIPKQLSLPKKNTPKLSISACILAKNDENVIEECIKSVADFVREIIVIDLGSTDQTVNIARKYTSRIFRNSWDNDYSEVRNNFLKYVSSDWVLYMDAYERLSPESSLLFTPKFLDKKNVAYLFKIVEMYQDKEIETFSCRLFRRTKDIRFKWAVHESVSDDVQKVSRKENLGIKRSDVVIHRYIYLKYFDDMEIHKINIELADHGLKNDKVEETVRIYYKLIKALSFSSLGESEEAEKIMNEVIEEIRDLDPKTVYGIPLFMQPFMFFCFKYSKQEKYDQALKIIHEAATIYNNSLTVLVRYCEQLYMNKHYKSCLDHIAKIIELQKDDKYYHFEPVDFAFVNKLTNKLEDLAYEKYVKSSEG